MADLQIGDVVEWSGPTGDDAPAEYTITDIKRVREGQPSDDDLYSLLNTDDEGNGEWAWCDAYGAELTFLRRP